MSWLTIIWSMCFAVCWLMTVIHLLLALLGHRRLVNSLVAVMALGAGLVAFSELGVMQSASVDMFIRYVHVQHVGLALLLVPMPWYIRIHFGTGPRWLAWAGSSLWVLALLIDLFQPNGLTFSQITGLEQRDTFWGEPFTLVDGERNPLALVPDVGVLAILALVVTASFQLWRKGLKRRAGAVGGSICFFFIAAMAHVPLVDLGVLKMPSLIAPLFLSVIGAMSLELIYEVLASAKLSRQVSANEARWRNLLDNIQLLVVGVDKLGTLNYVNPHMVKVSGYSAPELLGQSYTITLPEEESSQIQGLFREALLGSPRQQLRTRLQTKNGEIRNVDWSTILQHDEHSAVSGTVSVGVDVTDRVRTERSLRERERELGRIGRLNMLGELAASLAHELNQPLTAILSNAQAARRFLASSPPKTGEINEILDDIVRDDKRAGEVIHNLRAMLKKEPGLLEKASLNVLIEDTLKMLQHELGSSQVDVGLQLDEDLPELPLVQVEILQVLMNLILNAVHSMNQTPAGERNLTVRTRVEPGFVRVEIADRGCGIAPDAMASLFEPFFTTRSAGLGMGLAICRRLIETHGGTITAANNPEVGATFSFSLPLRNSK